MTVFYKRLNGYEDRVRVLRCDVPGCTRELKDSDAAYEGWTERRTLNNRAAATHACRAHDGEAQALTWHVSLMGDAAAVRPPAEQHYTLVGNRLLPRM